MIFPLTDVIEHPQVFLLSFYLIISLALGIIVFSTKKFPPAMKVSFWGKGCKVKLKRLRTLSFIRPIAYLSFGLLIRLQSRTLYKRGTK